MKVKKMKVKEKMKKEYSVGSGEEDLFLLCLASCIYLI